jgi:hypothetical protein
VTLVLVVLLLPLVMIVVGVVVVLKATALLLRLTFGPIIWLANRPTRQRVELRHYYGDHTPR